MFPQPVGFYFGVMADQRAQHGRLQDTVGETAKLGGDLVTDLVELFHLVQLGPVEFFF